VSEKKYSRFIIFLIDGLSSATLERVVATGRIPTLARYMREGAYNNNVVSSFPTVTGPSHVPLFSGYNPSSIDIVGHNQYVRKEDTFENFLLHYDTFTRRFGDRKTLYQDFENSVAISEPFRAGAHAYRKNIFALADWARIRGPANGYVLRTTRTEYKKGRDLIVAWLHETDGLAHMSKRESHIAASLEQLDKFLKKFEKEIDEQTVLGFVSDHGMQKTNGNHFSLKRALKTLSKGKMQFRSYYDGGAFAQAYMQKNNSFKEHVFEEDLGGMPEKLAQLDATDLVLHRQSANVYVVNASRGAAQVVREGTSTRYKVINGSDPLELLKGVEKEKVDTAAGWLERSGESSYPDAIFQIRELLAAPSSGDIFVTAAPHTSFNVLTRWGVHGGLHRNQSVTFLLFNRSMAGMQQGVVRTSALPKIILTNKVGAPAQRVS